MIFDITSLAGLTALGHGAAVTTCTVVSAWLLARRDRYGKAGLAVVAGLFFTALWSIVALLSGSASLAASFAESLRNLSWLFAAYRLFASDGRHESVRPIRPVVMALAFVELLHPAMLLVLAARSGVTETPTLLLQLTALFRLMVAVGGLVLVHNLYVGASPPARLALRWPASALAALWVFDLNYYTVAYLAGSIPLALAGLRGVVAVVVGALIAIGAKDGSEELRFSPSRAVTFQSVSLMLIGAYLVTMVGFAQWLSYAGGDFAALMQLCFVAAASALALVVLPSRKLRGWVRVTIAKHLFQHRYDYRAEWLRFTRTIGRGGEGATPLQERVVQALADITESPAGLLLTPGDDGLLLLSARWLWPTADVPAPAMPSSASTFFERESFIVDLDDLRGGTEYRGEGAIVPEWLHTEPRAWALVPLLHYERLVGVVALARPPHARKLDWEDFDLLRVVGQQLASYLAEHGGQEALAEASRFDDFNRRIAFVMHDIKNLASQMSLLARNAELHAENPEFRADMLVTLRNSADKLNSLLARLSRYGASASDELAEFKLGRVARTVVGRYNGAHRVVLTQCEDCTVAGNLEAFEQALVHLVQNAVDASPADSPVFLRVDSDGIYGCVEVVDSGMGMSAEFIRSRLFKPFDSSKQGGFGIGAYEARELVRAMRGRLDVESREGLGTRFIVRLPLAAATALLDTYNRTNAKVA
ncbi:MAG TPA: XrtA/PEP-CTERM system histidine kinase PrsK [Novosphingobium sp.]|nr:XrtA/PEP-CTERM system histidine kinase PrsK [Novosphingobium sp.]